MATEHTKHHEVDGIAQLGGWLPHRRAARDAIIETLRKKHRELPRPLHPSVQALKDFIENDADAWQWFSLMFEQVPHRGKFRHDPVGGPQVRDYREMLDLINAVLDTAPGFNHTELVGFPINAILDWAMATPAGYAAFLDDRVNAHFKAILGAWCAYLDSPDSCYVLNEQPGGWMSPDAVKTLSLHDYENDPSAPHWGYRSWNDFFTRTFKDGKRPVAEPDDPKVIVSACEATPFKISTDVQLRSEFWLKGQPYSLHFMLNRHPRASEFVGGTVYQAFLSAYDYHRWHAPVSGTIVHAEAIDGTYYAEALSEHFDPGGPNLSQGYITQVAARAIVLIDADDADIGLVAFVAVGMAEVSSNILEKADGKPLVAGDHVTKGDQIGYFQFGGSTHCVVFREGVIREFSIDAIPMPDSKAVDVRARLATAN